MNEEIIQEKKKEFLEALDKKFASLNIKSLKLYRKYIGGDSWKKRFKRLIFTPNIVIKNKLRKIINKFFQNKTKPENIDFSFFIQNFNAIWEFDSIKFLIKKLKSDDVFYDIGAEKGLYTSFAIELCKEVHVFEPLPEPFKFLKENFTKHENLYLNQVAVSDNMGEIKISLDPTTIVEDIKKIYKKRTEEIIVPTITLDEYSKTHNTPTYIKMDIEGAEYLAIKGGESLFKNYSPLVIMEVLGDEFLNNALKAVNLLMEFGYHPYKLDYDGNILIANYQEIKKQKGIYNYVFKKQINAK